MALQFTRRLLSEWTDGVIVVQRVQCYCNGYEQEQSTVLFQYGRQPPEVPKPMRWITGWDGGPRGQNRYWSAHQLDQMMQQWLDAIHPEQQDDRFIVEAVRSVVRGALPDGAQFGDDAMHYEILCKLSSYIDEYMKRIAPLDSLCKQMSACNVGLG